MPLERLDKILASQNVGSRKEVCSLIKKGLIKVNNEITTKKDLKVNPETDKIMVSDKILDFKKYMYIMMNKPAGVVSASRDPKFRTVIDLVPEKLKRKNLFPVGRLDRDTKGLLIITNDGDFAHKILLPKKKIYKTYVAIIDSEVKNSTVKDFERGIKFKDGTICLPAELKVLKSKVNSLVEIKICEGKFHQIKRMFESVGMKVLYLQRIKIGGLGLDASLGFGECKELTKEDIAKIFKT